MFKRKRYKERLLKLNQFTAELWEQVVDYGLDSDYLNDLHDQWIERES